MGFNNDFNQLSNFYFFYPLDLAVWEEYKQGFKIEELFNMHNQDITPSNKHFTIQSDKVQLEKTAAINKYNLKESDEWTVDSAKKDLTQAPNFKSIVKYHDFPFDIKYTYYSTKSNGYLTRPRPEIMPHFVKGDNIGLVVSKQYQKDDDWHCVLCTNNIVSINLIAGAAKFGGGYIFPLYRYEDTFGITKKVENLNKSIADKIKESTSAEITT